MMISISQHVALMRQVWPGFQVRGQTSWLITWEGRLRPFHQSYLVRVFYCLGRDLDTVEILPTLPRVTVLEPLLARRLEDRDDPIPHHYPNPADPEFPILCLYDPREREWQLDDAIAETILPWTVNWLACYEGWRATGEWTGGGRHPTKEEIRSWGENKTRRSDQPVRFNAGAFNRLGRRIGTFASFPLMVAASVESSRPLSWRDWKSDTLVALQSLNALGQAGLLIGAERIIRIDAPANEENIRMDDWMRASTELPGAAQAALDEMGEEVAEIFLKEIAEAYKPLIDMPD